MSIISQAIQDNNNNFPPITKLDFQGNNLTKNSMNSIQGLITNTTKFVNLANNNIGIAGCEILLKYLRNIDSKLEEINLENNHLDNSAGIILIKGMQENRTIKKLNLSKNLLTEKISSELGQFLSVNDSLVELYLHQNNINGKGGANIFKALSENEQLRVLDLSRNQLGRCDPQCIQKLCQFFQQNKFLIHLDLSDNQFGFQDCKLIAEALKQNQTIYGFHFTQNYGYVNYNGYLIVPDETDEEEILFAKSDKRINNVQPVYSLEQLKKRYKNKVKNVCWICEGWVESEFEWIPKISGEKKCGPAFIHFDYANFNSQFLGPRDKFENKYHQTIMIPPTQALFFWTLGKRQLFAKNYSIHSLEGDLRKEVQIGEKKEVIKMNFLNFIKPEELKLLFNQYYTALTSVLPRDERFYRAISIKEKIIWNKNNSVFKDWRTDHEILQACFEVDWQNTRCARIIKDPSDLSATKQFLKQNYRQIKDYYKYFASLNPAQEIWCISQLVIIDITNQCSLVDDKLLRIQDVDIKFIAACSDAVFKGNSRNPERGLVRHQFLEFLVRIADDKYLKNAIAKNYEQAVGMLMKECLPVFAKFQDQEWRENKLWCEQCDTIMKKYLSMLKQIYDKYTGKKVKPGEKKFMSLGEFVELLKRSGIFENENFQEKDAFIAFNLGMMTQVDELNDNRIFKMAFVEFLEAVGRIAEKISLQKIGTVQESYEKRKQQPLFIKIESLLVQFLETVCDYPLRDSYEVPTVSYFNKGEESEEIMLSEDDDIEDEVISPSYLRKSKKLCSNFLEKLQLRAYHFNEYGIK